MARPRCCTLFSAALWYADVFCTMNGKVQSVRALTYFDMITLFHELSSQMRATERGHKTTLRIGAKECHS
jgi:hypothetical protein